MMYASDDQMSMEAVGLHHLTCMDSLGFRILKIYISSLFLWLLACGQCDVRDIVFKKYFKCSLLHSNYLFSFEALVLKTQTLHRPCLLQCYLLSSKIQQYPQTMHHDGESLSMFQADESNECDCECDSL